MSGRTTNKDTIIHMCAVLGLNQDGTRNGNGLITEMKITKQHIESIEKNILEIYKTIEHAVSSIEKKGDKTDIAIEENKKQIEAIKTELQNIAKSLEGNITQKTITSTLDTIKKYWWVLLLLIGNFATQIVSALKSFGVIP